MADEWISFDEEVPIYGEPLMVRFDGTTQEITYILETDEGETREWFEPYGHLVDAETKHEHSVLVTQVNNIEWRYINY